MRADQDTVLGGRYRLTSAIAVGGMGEVWQALDQLLDRVVAVKLLKPELAGDPGFLDRFRTEARNAAGLSHPSIATVYDYGELDGSAWLVMELVPGEPLSDLLAREGALDPRRAAALVAATASGLAAAHRAGLVHRDVKPGNLLVAPDGHVKITDFGIARAAASAPVTATGEVMGTAAYFAPEQAMGRRDLGPTADLYALGVVLYEALAGFRPFTGDSQVAIALAQVNEPPPPLPARVAPVPAALAMALLEKDPLQRPQHAEDVAAVAQLIAAGDDDAAARRLAAASPGPATGALDDGPLRGATALGATGVLAAGAAAAATRASAATPPATSVMPGATGATGAQRTAGHAAYGVTPPTSPADAPWADPTPLPGGGSGQQMSGAGVSSRPRSRLTVPLIGLIAVVVVIAAAFFAGLLPTGGTPTPTDTTTTEPAATPTTGGTDEPAEETPSPTEDSPTTEATPTQEEEAEPTPSATPTSSAPAPSSSATSPSASASSSAAATTPSSAPASSAAPEETPAEDGAATTDGAVSTPSASGAGASAVDGTAAGDTVVAGAAHLATGGTPHDGTDGDGTP